MTIGTAHFRDMHSAIRYYRQYGNSAADVRSKLMRGEIAIGAPKQVDGKPYPVCFTDRDGRYHISTGA